MEKENEKKSIANTQTADKKQIEKVATAILKKYAVAFKELAK